MKEVLLNSKCPNCGSAFEPDSIFGNLRFCKACKQWSIAYGNNGDNTFNENVMFRIVQFEVEQEQVKKDLYAYLLKECPLKVLKKITNISIEKVFIPVREIGSGDDRSIIPLNSQYSSVVLDLFEGDAPKNQFAYVKPVGVWHDKLIPREKQKAISVDDVRSMNIKMEEIDVSKASVDTKYNILRDDYYRVIYIPGYRINLKGFDKTWLYLGLKDKSDLKASRLGLEEAQKEESGNKMNSFVISIVLGAVFGAVYNFVSCSASVEENGFGFMVIIGGFFGFIFRIILGAVIGGIVGRVGFVQVLKLRKKMQLNRIIIN